MAGRSPLVLVALLLTAAGGPLVAGFLPAGPASLFDSAGAATGAAAIALLWALFVWPVLARDRDRTTIFSEGLLLLLLSAPFVIGLGRSLGTQWPALLSALGVLAAAVVVAGLWLAGPGREGGRDHWFVAFWVLVVAAIPLMNWVLMDFAGVRGSLGFRISPLLALRRILLEHPGAGPVPFLLTGLAFLATTTVTGMLRKGAAAVLILLFCGAAIGAEVVPILGEAYVPGRPVPVRVSGAADPVTVRIPGYWTATYRAGAPVWIPGIENLRSVEVNGETVTLSLRPAPSGKWLVSLGPMPADLLKAATERGFVTGRGNSVPGRMLRRLVDGVVDTTGILDRMEREILKEVGVAVIEQPGDLPGETALRRPWEEPGRVLSADGLDRVFGPFPGPDPKRARTTTLILFLFGAVSVAAIRFGSGRRWGTERTVVSIFPIAVSAILAAAYLLPGIPDLQSSMVVAKEGLRSVTVHRHRARRATTLEMVGELPAQVLGRGAEVLDRGGLIAVPFAAQETRFLVATDAASPVKPGPFDFFLTPDGLAKPGESGLPPGEFIRRHLPGPDGWLVRKLLRIDGSLRHKYGVRIPEPGCLEVLRVE